MTFLQPLAIPKDDHRAQFSDCRVAHYFAYAYGTCNQCSSPIQLPGLDHSYCSNCQDWLASRLVLNSAIELSNLSSISPRPPAQVLSHQESKPAVTEQLELWGGVA